MTLPSVTSCSLPTRVRPTCAVNRDLIFLEGQQSTIELLFLTCILCRSNRGRMRSATQRFMREHVAFYNKIQSFTLDFERHTVQSYHEGRERGGKVQEPVVLEVGDLREKTQRDDRFGQSRFVQTHSHRVQTLNRNILL